MTAQKSRESREPRRPHRTAERILDVALALFNRFGEPNVSTSQLCAELGMSPGNLFYHHPTRDALVAGLFARYEGELARALPAAMPQEPARGMAIAPPPATPPAGGQPLSWDAQATPALQALSRRMHALSSVSWAYRFLFRDLSDLVSRHRVLEEQIPRLLRAQAQTLHGALLALPRQQGMADDATLRLWTGHMLASLTGCVGLDGALDPREHLRGDREQSVRRATARALGLLLPALGPQDRMALSVHLSEGDGVGADPWWLRPGDE